MAVNDHAAVLNREVQFSPVKLVFNFYTTAYLLCVCFEIDFLPSWQTTVGSCKKVNAE